jgi:hypothetical protein
MATIMSGGGAMGGPNGGDRRCDAKCHEAKPGSSCDCICGGAYHARGSSESAQEQLTKDWLGEDWREQYGQFVKPALQETLGGAA